MTKQLETASGEVKYHGKKKESPPMVHVTASVETVTYANGESFQEATLDSYELTGVDEDDVIDLEESIEYGLREIEAR